jgi:hypothetical protein
MAPAVTPNNRKTAATNVPVAGRTCMYQFKRGENKGKFCGKATSPGSEFCNTCMKTRKNLAKEMAAGGIPGAAPAMGAIPGMAGLPQGYAPPAAQTQTQPGQLNVVPYDEARGLFLEPTHHFIVTQVSPGIIAALGRLVEATNEIVPLNAQEQSVAQSIGLSLGAAPQTNTATTPPPVPAVAPSPVPAIPAVAAIPAIPTVAAVPAIPTVAAVPAIPTAAGVPAIPTAVPAIPNIQQGLAPTGAPALPVIAPLAGQPPQSPLPAAAGVPQIPGIPQIAA